MSAAEGLVNHTKTFDQALAKLDTVPRASQSRAALTSTKPLVKPCFAAAERAVKAAHAGEPVNEQSMADLHTSFTDLEVRMAALSDSIEKNGEALNAHATGSVVKARSASFNALLLATLASVGLAMWLWRRIARPMMQAVHAPRSGPVAS